MNGFGNVMHVYVHCEKLRQKEVNVFLGKGKHPVAYNNTQVQTFLENVLSEDCQILGTQLPEMTLLAASGQLQNAIKYYNSV